MEEDKSKNINEKSGTSEENIFQTEDGKKFTITPEGSVGLLALGAVGLKAWRKVRQQAAKDKKDIECSEEDSQKTEND